MTTKRCEVCGLGVATGNLKFDDLDCCAECYEETKLQIDKDMELDNERD